MINKYGNFLKIFILESSPGSLGVENTSSSRKMFYKLKLMTSWWCFEGLVVHETSQTQTCDELLDEILGRWFFYETEIYP